MQSFFRFRTLELIIGRTEEDYEEEDPKVLVFSETVEVCDERMQDRARRAMASEHTEKNTEKERVRIPPLQ